MFIRYMCNMKRKVITFFFVIDQIDEHIELNYKIMGINVKYLEGVPIVAQR